MGSLLSIISAKRGQDLSGDIDIVKTYLSAISEQLEACRSATEVLVERADNLLPFAAELTLSLQATEGSDAEAIVRLTAQRDLLLSRRSELDRYAEQTEVDLKDASKRWDEVSQSKRQSCGVC